MSLQINTTLTTDSGFIVPSGSYAKFEIHVKTGYNYRFILSVYRDQASFDNGESKIMVKEFDTLEEGTFTVGEITDLGVALTYLQTMLIDRMEAKIGETGVIVAV